VHAGIFKWGEAPLVSANGIATTGASAWTPFTATNNAYYAVGAGASAGLFANADITAAVMFHKAHNAETRKRVEQWLGARYGITVAT
jgi:hypothetical protein